MTRTKEQAPTMRPKRRDQPSAEETARRSVGEQEAAEVRAAVTPELMADRGNFPHGDPVTEALILARHLAPGRDADAMLAHKVLVKEMHRQLDESGVADEWYGAVVNALVAFLYRIGYRYAGKGEWTPDPPARGFKTET